MGIFLSPYVGSGTRADPFRPAVGDGAWHSIDLRPDQSVAAGFALVSADSVQAGDKLADTPGEMLPAAIRNRLQNRLGISVADKTLGEIIGDLLIRVPDGKWNRLWASPLAQKYEIWLGDLIYTEDSPTPLSLDFIDPFDNFNRANETPLAAPWVRSTGSTGNINLSSNTITKSADGDCFYSYPGSAASGDHFAQAKIVTKPGSNDWGPAVRVATGALTGYFYEEFATGVGLMRMNAGSFTQMTNIGNDSTVVGDVLRIEASGTTITAKKNGTTRSTITDAALSGGQPGIFWFASGGAVDDWMGGDLTGVIGVSSIGYNAAAGTTLTATRAGVLAGSKLIAVCSEADGTDTPTITDNQGNTWTRRVLQRNAGIPATIALFEAIASAAGTVTITLNTASATFRRVGFIEVNANLYDTFDLSSSASGASGAISSGSITARANSLLVGWMVSNAGITSPTTGWTEALEIQLEEFQYRESAAGGADAASAPADGTPWLALVASFYKGPPPPNLIGTNSATATGTSSTITVPAGGVPAGAQIVVATQGFLSNTAKVATSVTDSKGNTYTLDETVTRSGVGLAFFTCAGCLALAAGDVITITFPSSNERLVIAAYMTGVQSPGALDKHNNSQGAGGAATITNLAANSQIGEIVWAASASDLGDTLGVSAPFSLIASLTEGVRGSALALAYKIVSIGETSSATFTGNNSNWGDILATYRFGAVSSNTPISGTDTGTDAEAQSLTAQISSAQTASDSETTSQTAQISASADTSTDSESTSLGLAGSDTGTDAEASSSTAQLAGSETASGSEATSQTALISGTDASTDSEIASIGNTPISGSDTATDAEASALTAAIPGAETSTDAEATALRLAGTDTGTDTEINALTAQLPGTDSGTEAETTKIALSGFVDQGSDSEASALTAALGGTESGTAGETASNGSPVSGSDTGTSAQVATLAAFIGATEAASTIEAISNLARVTIPDAATIAEIALQSVLLSGADASISAQSVFLAAAFVLQDSGVISESAVAVQAPIMASDTAFFSETAMVSFGAGKVISQGAAPRLLLETEIPAELVGARIPSGTLLGRKAKWPVMLSARPASGQLIDTEVD